MNELNDHHKNKIRRCFNRSALTYNQHSQVQQISGSKLVDHLYKYTREFESVIDLGCGSGIVTEQLAYKINYKKFYAIDIADKLIHQAKARLSSYPIYFYNADFEYLPFEDKSFDLMFSNMSLHWSTELFNTLLIINKKTLDQGWIAFTLPLCGTFSELTSSSRNNFYQLNDIYSFLILSGFEPLVSVNEKLTLHFDSWVNALKSIKATGANYVFNNVKKSLSNAEAKRNFTQIKCLSYQVGYFIARKNYHVI